MLSVVGVFLALCTFCVHADVEGVRRDGKLATPIGWLSEKCIHVAEHEECILDHVHNGVWAKYPKLNKTVFHPELPECVEETRVLLAEYRAKRLAAKDTSDVGDGWVQDGGYTTPVQLAEFSSNYVLPYAPASTNGGQIMYYFIGAQNNGDGSDITIIQPVVIFCGSSGGCGNPWTQGGWMLAAWDCCASGQSWYGTGVASNTGERVTNYVYSYNGQMTVSMTGQYGTSSLTKNNDYRHYDWANFALEAYNYGSCSDFSNGQFWFEYMKITGNDGQVYTPQWQISNGSPCNGQIACQDPATCYIKGTA